MTYGPDPWQQAHWDWRAAGNFVFGGAGAGLLAFTVLAAVHGIAAIVLLLAGMGLIGLGLLCVWLEIGRPLRAFNVMRRPGSSWMTREAMVAPLVFLSGLATAAGVSAAAPLLLVAALAFVYCQARIVQGAKGIPAWRERSTVPLLVITGLAEGAGLFWLAGASTGTGAPLLALVFAALALGRWQLWRTWRRRVGASAAAPALAAIDRSGRVLQTVGSALPIVLALLAAAGTPGAPLLLAAAGLCAALTGAWFKFTLITRAAFNQGFQLPRLPVRGVPR